MLTFSALQIQMTEKSVSWFVFPVVESLMPADLLRPEVPVPGGAAEQVVAIVHQELRPLLHLTDGDHSPNSPPPRVPHHSKLAVGEERVIDLTTVRMMSH